MVGITGMAAFNACDGAIVRRQGFGTFERLT
jgi:hypothetical protein